VASDTVSFSDEEHGAALLGRCQGIRSVEPAIEAARTAAELGNVRGERFRDIDHHAGHPRLIFRRQAIVLRAVTRLSVTPCNILGSLVTSGCEGVDRWKARRIAERRHLSEHALVFRPMSPEDLLRDEEPARVELDRALDHTDGLAPERVVTPVPVEQWQERRLQQHGGAPPGPLRRQGDLLMRAPRVEEAGRGDVTGRATHATRFAADTERGLRPVVVLRQQTTGKGRLEEQTMAEGASARQLRSGVARVRGNRRIVVPEGAERRECSLVEDGREIGPVIPRRTVRLRVSRRRTVARRRIRQRGGRSCVELDRPATTLRRTGSACREREARKDHADAVCSRHGPPRPAASYS
jgi:hypothetical protein